MRSIVLASASPRRRELLKSLGLKIKVIPSRIDERMNPRLGPHAQARVLSLQKAQKVFVDNRFLNDEIIIAADSIVVFNKEQLGKPESIEIAQRMLKKLSGSEHRVVTGYTILDTRSKKTISNSVETKVFMRKLNIHEIRNYVKKVNVLDKAGSYAMQGLGAAFFEKIDGDYYNVVGLPIFSLAKDLKKFKIDIICDIL